MIYKTRSQYFNTYGAKTTLITEIFKENENNGKSITQIQVDLLEDKVIKSRMLDYYTNAYKKTKHQIGWM